MLQFWINRNVYANQVFELHSTWASLDRFNRLCRYVSSPSSDAESGNGEPTSESVVGGVNGDSASQTCPFVADVNFCCSIGVRLTEMATSGLALLSSVDDGAARLKERRVSTAMHSWHSPSCPQLEESDENASSSWTHTQENCITNTG